MINLKKYLLESKCVQDNIYLDKYIELIENNLSTLNIKGKTQRHHILPRCYFKNMNLPIDNSEYNLVNLLYKDHILAHYYLSLCGSNDYYSYTFENAFMYLVNKRENTEININVLESYQKIYEDLIRKKSQFQKGQGKGVCKSEETRRKMSEAQKNMISIYKDNVIKRVNKKDLDSYVNNGWIIGRPALTDSTKYKISLSNTGKVCTKETKEKISNSLKGNTPWNKGLTKKDTRVAKNIINNSSIWQKGHIPWNTGKTFSEETRRKMSESAKNRGGTVTGRKVLYNPITDIQVFSKVEDIEKYLNEGFKFGKRPINTKESRYI